VRTPGPYVDQLRRRGSRRMERTELAADRGREPEAGVPDQKAQDLAVRRQYGGNIHVMTTK